MASCFLDVPTKEHGKGYEVYVGENGDTRISRLGSKNCLRADKTNGNEGGAHLHGMLFTTDEFMKFDARGLTQIAAQAVLDIVVLLVRRGFQDQVWTWRNPHNNDSTRKNENHGGLWFDPCLQSAAFGGHRGKTDYS